MENNKEVQVGYKAVRQYPNEDCFSSLTFNRYHHKDDIISIRYILNHKTFVNSSIGGSFAIFDNVKDLDYFLMSNGWYTRKGAGYDSGIPYKIKILKVLYTEDNDGQMWFYNKDGDKLCYKIALPVGTRLASMIEPIEVLCSY